MPVPALRIRAVNQAECQPKREFVLYWMIAQRRASWNFSLQRAVEWAVDLKRPLVILEALRVGYRWASDRLHQFIIDGMADNRRQLAGREQHGIYYFPYVEPKRGHGDGLLPALARQSCVVVTDDYPCFFLPRLVAAAGDRIDVRLEAVDSCGLLPMREAPQSFTMAFHFRRWLQKNLRPHLESSAMPAVDPLEGECLPSLTRLPAALRPWPATDLDRLQRGTAGLAELPIDHSVPVAPATGGPLAAARQLSKFLDLRLGQYGECRNQPDEDVASGLSPYLHFGHISAHQVFAETISRQDWSLEKLAAKADGKSRGWWGLSPAGEAFLDQVVTWRELGFNFCSRNPDYDRFESLPAWAQRTLNDHADDERPKVYTLEQFERANTHDPIWNAAQRQLVREGSIHNYLRMLWGKKILEWTATPREALSIMIELNNKYALDGRDPNSYSGIGWCLGRFDRPWAPQRPVFGTVRYMSSQNTARKLRLKNYLRRYAEGQS